jgi:hypothetical protein
MNPLWSFLSHTRLWIFPAGVLWLFLLGMNLELGFLRFETIDALYYRELALDFLSGLPMTLDGLLNAKGNSFSPYPPGYPVLLGITAQIGGGNFDWPVHILLHAFLALLLIVIWQTRLSLLPLAVLFFTDSVLMLAAAGISEFSFIIFSILAVFSLTRLQFSSQAGWQIFLIGSSIGALLIRYAGIFLFPLILYRWFVLVSENKEKASVLLLPIFLFLLAAGILFGTQWMDTGMFTGGDRYPNTDVASVLVSSLFTGILNQAFIFRDLSGSSWISFSLGAVLNAIFLWLIFRSRKFNPVVSFPHGQDENHELFRKVLSQNLLAAGCIYLLFIIAMRWYFYFAEYYDNRLIAPGACLIWLGFLVRKEDEILTLSFSYKLIFLLVASIFFIPWRVLL